MIKHRSSPLTIIADAGVLSNYYSSIDFPILSKRFIYFVSINIAFVTKIFVTFYSIHLQTIASMCSTSTAGRDRNLLHLYLLIHINIRVAPPLHVCAVEGQQLQCSKMDQTWSSDIREGGIIGEGASLVQFSSGKSMQCLIQFYLADFDFGVYSYKLPLAV